MLATKNKGKKSGLKGPIAPKFSTSRKSLGYGVGLVGMSRTGGRDTAPMPQHAVKASRKRAVKASFKSDKAAAAFKTRAKGGEVKKSSQQTRNKKNNSEHLDNQIVEENVVVSKDNITDTTSKKTQIGMHKKSIAGKLNISERELDRRIRAIKRALPDKTTTAK